MTQEIPTTAVAESAPLLPQNRTFRIVNGIVHVFLGGQLFLAMIPQGAAAWVQSIGTGGWVKEVAPIIGIGSHLGKFALLLYFSTVRFNPDSPSGYENIALFLTRNSNAQNQSIHIKIGKYFVAVVGPGLGFGLLTYLTLDAFIETVEKEQMDGIFTTLAEIARNPVFRHLCAVSSFNGNLISAPNILNAIYYTIKSIHGNIISLKNNTVALHEKNPMVLKLLLGSGFTITTSLGFGNFFSLTGDSVVRYLNFLYPVTPLMAFLSAEIQLSYMLGLGMMASFGLANKATKGIFDICRADWKNLDWNKIIALGFTFVFTLAIVIPGGLPNVFQAMFEKEGYFIGFMALFASAITEAEGTFELLKKPVVPLVRLASTGLTACKARLFRDPAYEVIPDQNSQKNELRLSKSNQS